MTEAAFLRNRAGQHPNGLGLGGPGREGKGEKGEAVPVGVVFVDGPVHVALVVGQFCRRTAVRAARAATLPTRSTARAHTPTGEKIRDALVGTLLRSFPLAHGRHRARNGGGSSSGQRGRRCRQWRHGAAAAGAGEAGVELLSSLGVRCPQGLGSSELSLSQQPSVLGFRCHHLAVEWPHAPSWPRSGASSPVSASWI